MELNYFKDKIFDILNENDKIGISDIDMNEARTQLLAAIDAYYEAMGGQLQQAPAEKLPEKAQVK